MFELLNSGVVPGDLCMENAVESLRFLIFPPLEGYRFYSGSVRQYNEVEALD